MIIETLAKFKNIEPGSEFQKRSLTLILNSPQNPRNSLVKNFLQVFQSSGALALASLLIVLILGGLSALNLNFFSPAVLASLDDKNLNKEMSDLDLKINLPEVQYYEDSISQVSVALNETYQNLPSHLDPSVIEKEAQKVNSVDSENKSLDQILNELVL